MPPSTIDEYIASAEPHVRSVLEEIRRVARAAAPGAEEVISYRMPALRQHGILVYFGAFKHHIGLFPPVSGDAKLEKAIAPFAGPKGNLKFPLDAPIPYSLVARIVKLRVKQLAAKHDAKRTHPSHVARKKIGTPKPAKKRAKQKAP